MAKAQYTVRKGFILSLGPITASTRLMSVTPSAKDEVKTLCAKHKVPINQIYRCPEDEELSPETVKGLVLGNNSFQVYSPEEAPKFTADDGLTFTAVPAAMFEASCLPLDNNYYVAPEATGVMAWEVLYKLAQDPKRALITIGALRENSRKLYRLRTFNEYLVLTAYTFPEHVREAPDRPEVSVPRDMMTLAKKFLDTIEVDWAKYDATDQGRKAFRDFVAAQGVPVSTEPVPTEPNNTSPIDLMDALRKSVEQTKTKTAKPPRKKAS